MLSADEMRNMGVKKATIHRNKVTQTIVIFVVMPQKKSSLGPIWAVVIAGALLLVVVQFLPDKAGAQKLAHFFIAIALIAALAIGFMDRKKDKGEE